MIISDIDENSEVKSKYPEPKVQIYETEPEGIKFTPPLYRQRYDLAIDFIKKVRPTKVVDFGCAECKFLWSVRNISYGSVREIIGVDIDREVLERHIQVAKPVTSEYLIRRSTPLKISLFCGSLTDFDQRVEGVDFVSLIEVIEHLYDDVLTQMPPAIFGRLRPKHVLITTPNSEFNILFNLNGFRHPDHKFEWTRDDFMSWCEAVCQSFPYLVEFCGVGEPPMGMEEVGYCSQAAFFSLKPEVKTEPNFSGLENGDANGTKDCDVDLEQTPRESIFSDIVIPPLILDTERSDTSKTGPNNTFTQEPTETTELKQELSLPYEVLISTDFPTEDPNITPADKLIKEVEYYANQIARNEWKKLNEQLDVREEDLHNQPVQSESVYFEPGTGPGHIVAFVSVAQRLMLYPQIRSFGDLEFVLNTIISSESGNLNSELTHYRVELMVEEPGYDAGSDEKEGDSNSSQDDQVEWDNIFQGEIKEKSCVTVPESWDDDDWDKHS